MRTYINEKHIEKRTKLGRRTSMIGLVVLMIGMAASFSPGVIAGWAEKGNELANTAPAQWLLGGGWIFVSMGALLIGFLLGQIGNANVRSFAAYPRADQVIAKALKGFDDRNHFYAWATPTDLVLAGPAGIFTFVTRGLGGKITIQDGKIKQPFSFRRILFAFGQEPGGLPGEEAQGDADKLSAWLTEQIGSDEPVTVKPLVVFTNEKAELDVQDSGVPIIHYKQLKQFLNKELRGSRLNKTTLTASIAKLDEEAERRGAEAE
jgi:hypothetical protein